MMEPETDVAKSEETNQARPASVAEVFETLEAPLLRYARRLVGEADLAEDLVQEAFLKLHVHFEWVREPRVWLYRTLHNLAMNHHRSARKLVRLPGDGEGDGEPGFIDPDPRPDARIERMEAIGQTRLCLEALEPRGRELVRLKFEEDLSYKEMSERTGLSVSNVGFILHHTLKSLAADLEKAGIAL